MPRERRHVASGSGSRWNSTLERRLRLLQEVLPYLSNSVVKAYVSEKLFKREFWSKFLNSLTTMEMYGWRFDRITNEHEHLVKAVLNMMEQIVSIKDSDIAHPFRSTPFPKLETLRNIIKDPQTDRNTFCVGLVKPDTTGQCNRFINAFKDLSVVIEDKAAKTPPETSQAPTKLRPSMCPLQTKLFSTLSSYWPCSCNPCHQAALLLLASRGSTQNDAFASFRVLLSNGFLPGPGKRWKETQVTVHPDQINKPRVRMALPESNDTLATPVSDLCATVTNSTTLLNLKVQGSTLSSQAETELPNKNFELCKTVSFTNGFLKNDVELGSEGRMCLAVVLSYAFLDFCGDAWFPAGWTKESLYFMQDDRKLSLQPFLITKMKTDDKKPAVGDTSTASRALKLLQHGILLMEIFQQSPLGVMAELDSETATLGELAMAEFNDIQWDVFERFQQAVGSCIRGDLFDSYSNTGDSSLSDETFIQLFHERVLGLLEADFTSLCQNKDADSRLSEIELPKVHPKPEPRKPKPEALKTYVSNPQRWKHLSIKSIKIASMQMRHSTASLARFSSGLNPPNLFFDGVDMPELPQIHSATRWLESFEEERIRSRMPQKPPNEERRIRIAVLDTGIDFKNLWISRKFKNVKCWPQDWDHQDNDGHGTHVAYLLLRLAPHARIFVTKVSESRHFEGAKIMDVINRIALAIETFSSDPYRVDIINLSFGFFKFAKELVPIQKAIQFAKSRGVIIFAAAGNEGGNQGVCWPAALHSSGDVIRINSSDGYGKPSLINPDFEDGRRICTLGEGVPSCQVDSDMKIIHGTGTSFATPIAAAIASIVLGVMDSADLARFPNAVEVLPRLRTRLGMERVLCEVCTRSSGHRSSGFSYITPWHFLDIDREILIPRVLGILYDIPESL